MFHLPRKQWAVQNLCNFGGYTAIMRPTTATWSRTQWQSSSSEKTKDFSARNGTSSNIQRIVYSFFWKGKNAHTKLYKVNPTSCDSLVLH